MNEVFRLNLLCLSVLLFITTCSESTSTSSPSGVPYTLHVDSSHFYLRAEVSDFSIDTMWTFTLGSSKYEHAVMSYGHAAGVGILTIRDSAGRDIAHDTLSVTRAPGLLLSQHNDLSIRISLSKYSGKFAVAVSPLGERALPTMSPLKLTQALFKD